MSVCLSVCLQLVRIQKGPYGKVPAACQLVTSSMTSFVYDVTLVTITIFRVFKAGNFC